MAAKGSAAEARGGGDAPSAAKGSGAAAANCPDATCPDANCPDANCPDARGANGSGAPTPGIDDGVAPNGVDERSPPSPGTVPGNGVGAPRNGFATATVGSSPVGGGGKGSPPACSEAAKAPVGLRERVGGAGTANGFGPEGGGAEAGPPALKTWLHLLQRMRMGPAANFLSGTLNRV